LCVLGIAGNLLTLVVLRYNSHKKKSTSWLLQVLAVVDCLYLLSRLSTVLFQFGACRHGQWLSLVASRRFAAVAPYMASGAVPGVRRRTWRPAPYVASVAVPGVRRRTWRPAPFLEFGAVSGVWSSAPYMASGAISDVRRRTWRQAPYLESGAVHGVRRRTWRPARRWCT